MSTTAAQRALLDIRHLASPGHLARKLEPGAFRWRPHIRAASDFLADLTFGDQGRWGIIDMPPQYAKSSTVTKWGSVWALEQHARGALPGGRVGIASYAADLARYWSRQARNIVKFHGGTDLVAQLSRDQNTVTDWETVQGGSILSAGIAGGFTGRSLDIAIVDDPIKNAEEANSHAARDAAWRFWEQTLFPRLQPWTVVLYVMTRWHHDDPVGRLLDAEWWPHPENWRVLRIPALAEPKPEEPDPLGRAEGEPLLRPQIDETVDDARAHLVSIRDNLHPSVWAGMWQQRPSSIEGDIFDVTKINYWGGEDSESLPVEWDQLLFSWDMAFVKTDDSSFVVGELWGKAEARYYLLAQVRGRWGYIETRGQVIEFVQGQRAHYPEALGVLVEDKANGPAIIDDLKTIVPGLIPTPPKGDKPARAKAVSPLFAAGNVYVPASSIAPWVRDYLAELAEFPRGSHDDQVDATSQALIYLSQPRPSKIKKSRVGLGTRQRS